MFEYFSNLYWQKNTDEAHWKIYSSLCDIENNLNVENQGLNEEQLNIACKQRMMAKVRGFQILFASQSTSSTSKITKPFIILEIKTSQSVQTYHLPLTIKQKDDPLCYIKSTHNGIIIGIENYAAQYFYQIFIPNYQPDRLLNMGKYPSILKIRQYCGTMDFKPEKLTLFQLILNKL